MDKSREKQNLSRNIKGLRISQHMTQYELADRAGININTLERIEQNTENPQIETLCLLANALDCDLYDFFKKNDPDVVTINSTILDEKAIQTVLINTIEQIQTIIWKEIKKL